MIRDKLYDKETFYTKVKEELGKVNPLEEGSNYELNTMYKVNDIKLCGLAAKGPERKTSPNLYLNSFYDEYKKSGSFEETLIMIAESFRSADVKSKDLIPEKPDLSLENIKDRLEVQIVDTKLNKNRLNTMFHTDMEGGFAATYYIIVRSDETGRNSIPVSKSMMESIGCTGDELHQAAFKNMAEKSPATIINLETQMSKLLLGEIPQPQLLSDSISFEKNNLYVLTTTGKENGATALWYPGVMKTVGDLIDKDYYVIPSSLHEVIIMPKGIGFKPREILQMVIETNKATVAPSDKLADKVLAYDRDSDKFYVAMSPEALREEAR